MVAPSRTKRSNDFTGRQAEELAKKAIEEQKRQTEQTAQMVAQEKAELENTIFDATITPASPTIVDEVIEQDVMLQDDYTIIRAAEDVSAMTYGYGNDYSFKAGVRYKVPRAVADRMQELGLLYERM